MRRWNKSLERDHLLMVFLNLVGEIGKFGVQCWGQDVPVEQFFERFAKTRSVGNPHIADAFVFPSFLLKLESEKD